MELDDLKSAWNKISSENEKKLQLNEDDFQNLLGKRTLDISEKISRNIRIGIAIIIAWVVLGSLFEFVISPQIDKFLNKPYLTDNLLLWSYVCEVFLYVLVVIAVIIFWIRFNKVIKTNSDSTNLKSKISQLIRILNTYRTMFYLIFGIFILYIIAAFSSGFFMEINFQSQDTGLDFGKINLFGWIFMIFVFLFTLGILIALYYLLFNFFFKRLYGRYLNQLKSTLKELDDVNSLH